MFFQTVNTTGCEEVTDLNDESEKYMRTVCLSSLRKTHHAAEKNCLLNGMSLFMLEPPEAKKALLDFANKRFDAVKGKPQNRLKKKSFLSKGNHCAVLSVVQLVQITVPSKKSLSQ
jgi:hypothetical protein